MGGALRRFDFHARKLLLSDLLEPSGRVFHLAVTLVNLELGDVLDQEAHRAAGLSEDARAMLRSTLASYAAAALMMPYQLLRGGGAVEIRYRRPAPEVRGEL